MKYDREVGVNWHLRFRLEIDKLKTENEKLQAKNNILERKIKKYEDHHIRSTRNGKDNNVVKFGGSIHPTRD
jgi:cell division protein FtsB